jgi:phosphoglucosamine mutase
MITASHNPFYDNGIKVINRYGEKLDDSTTALIEAYIDGELDVLGVEGEDLPLATGDKVGAIIDYVAGRNRYVAYLISLASNSYKNLRIGIDCANGASWMIAQSVFGALGAQLYVVGNTPNGVNINEGCGSMHVDKLAEFVKANHLDMGFAFDGDADRCLAVDENGRIVDGDAILFILAKRLKARGMLNKDTVVPTVMSNSGFFKSLDKLGIKTEQTTVGDRFVYECMQANDYSLGVEQSGHIIIKKYATTGDGLLTAIMLAEEVCDTKSSLGTLTEGLTVYPQLVKNVKVTSKDAVFNDEAVQAAFAEVEALIGGEGRALLRKSGTEPKIRVMIEALTEELCEEYADKIVKVILERGYGA